MKVVAATERITPLPIRSLARKRVIDGDGFHAAAADE